jgi:1-acyl-sn-glycerol-3-phosphate acyltransferase
MNKFVYQLAKALLYGFYKTCFDVRYFGTENVPNGPHERGVILAPNHESYLDPPLTGTAIKPCVTYFAKEYLFRKPVLGLFLHAVGAYPVREKTRDCRSIRETLRLLADGHVVTIFPEGTRSPDGQLQKSQNGVGFLAIKANAVVIPVYLKGTYEALPRNAKWIRCKSVEVHYGKPLIPAREASIMSSPDPYGAVGERIMEEIRILRQRVG